MKKPIRCWFVRGSNALVNKRNADPRPVTPLQNAAYLGNVRIASLLLAAGAQVNTKGTTGRTALHFAVLSSRLDVMQLLIEKGADLNTRDVEGTSPLDDAVWRGSPDAVAILMAHGARLNEADSKTDATPINEAGYLGDTALIRYLLQFNPDLAAVDKHGYGSLENATRMGKEDSAVLLLEAEAREKGTPQLSGRILEAAIRKDESVLVAALLRYGVAANETMDSGSTPLEAGASAKAIKVVRVLLESGADANMNGWDGSSPLEDASLAGFDAIVETLLDHGAPVNQTTALYGAASFGKVEVVRLLLERGANPALCGKNHKSPYEAALENGNREVARGIEKHGGAKGCEQ
jgi:ankyrin repeat protein